jgi:hypothetical protein
VLTHRAAAGQRERQQTTSHRESNILQFLHNLSPLKKPLFNLRRTDSYGFTCTPVNLKFYQQTIILIRRLLGTSNDTASRWHFRPTPPLSGKRIRRAREAGFDK